MKQINIKVDVPDGFVLDKIETSGDNIVAFVKEKEKFKRGDVITLIDQDLSKDSVVILEEIATTGYWPIGTIRGFTIKSSKINRNAAYNKDYFANSRFATFSEAQLLFDALAKDGEKWNPKTLQIEDIEKDILVPECIGIYRLSDRATTSHDNGDGLYISFNEYKQVLFYSDGQYGVFNLDNICLTKVQCKLTPCKREDLKAGDTFLMKDILQDVEDILYDPSEYVKSMTARANEFAWIDEGTDVISSKMDDSHKQLYKVEPITK